VAAKAIGAYEAGANGAGVKVGIVDYGMPNPALPEFAGRVDPASRDMVGTGRFDTSSHGTWMASIIAANRNGAGTQGVAFGASVISLDVSDLSCTSGAACSTNFPAMIRAIDFAVQNGARVINFSAGPGPSWQPAEYVAAMRRAAEAGVVLVFASGNNGAAGPIVNVTRVATELADFGNVIVAGAHDGERQMATFSDRAGDVRSYLTALGVSVGAANNNGEARFLNGTSFSAPTIVGAVALLAGAFPNLKGREIVEILFRSADDAGAAGWDNVYGHGILNISRAFQPMGATSIAGSNAPISTTFNGQSSGPMGDAKARDATITILDSYSRAFTMNLSATISGADVERTPAHSLAGADYRTAEAVAGGVAVSLTTRRNPFGRSLADLALLGLSQEEAGKAKAVAGMVISRIAPQTVLALGVSASGRMLQQRLSEHFNDAFSVARDAVSLGFHTDVETSFGILHRFGSAGLTVTSEQGGVPDYARRFSRRGDRYNAASVIADRTGPRTRIWLGASRLSETSTALGARFSEAFWSGGSTTHFLDAGGRFDPGAGWSLSGSYRRGWTKLQGTGALLNKGLLKTAGFEFGVAKHGSLLNGDKIALRIVQPLRVSAGGLNLTVPVDYNYSNGSVRYDETFFNLAPEGRELAFELGYGVRALGGRADFNTFVRSDPGHVETMKSDMGAAIRYSLRF
jgi:hypothetical protein